MHSDTKLSVNINKIATLRNSRGGNVPDLIEVAVDIQNWGADGITVHPRPDERHIKYSDIPLLREVVHTEFNIEGNPKHEAFIDLVLDNKPEQVTLVPDSDGQLTSDHGWDTKSELSYLKEVVSLFQKNGIRVSIFLNPIEEMVQYAAETGTDRIELYTEAYAKGFDQKDNITKSYSQAAKLADQLGMAVNAGHDLDLSNLKYFARNVRPLHEVSIGHALISDAIYLGLQNTVQLYKRQLENE